MPRALIFDADPGCRKLLTEILKKKAYEVTALAGPACYLTVEKADECPVNAPHHDLLLTDHRMMGGMNGLDFLELSRQCHCKIPDRRKALFSDDLSAEVRARAERLGCTLFEKPYDREAILQWLEGQR